MTTRLAPGTAHGWNFMSSTSPCCAASPYASSHAIALGSAPATTDLADPQSLARVARARSYHGELILFSFDFCGIAEALSLVLSLRRASFEHFLPYSDGVETCDALHTAARLRDIDHLPCYFSSWPRDHAGWKMWGHGPGCVSASRPSHSCVLEQLWASRYAVAGQILALGDINVLHIDTDSAILADPYAWLKTAPLAEQNLIILPESPINGGMWYAQNTTAGAGAQWVIAEVARRTLAVIDQPLERRMLPPFDQAMLGDVLYTAADGGTPHWGAACEHPALRKSALCPPNVTRHARGMRWDVRVRLAPSTAAAAAALMPLLAPGKRNAKGSQSKGSQTAFFRSAQLRVPGSARVERAATAPPWLFPNAWKAQQLGHFARRPAAMAIAHLLGARCRWCESSEDVDHGAKWEWQHLAGFWPSRAYTLAPPLATADGGATAASAATTAFASFGAASAASAASTSALRVEFGSLNASFPERVERHCRKRGRARLLYADRRVLSLSRSAPAFQQAEAADDDGAAARTLIRRLLVLASLAGRMAVLPSFNCSAPWVRKAQRADGSLAMIDLRVVTVDVAEARELEQQRCAPCNVQFACRQHVLSEAQWRAVADEVLAAEHPEPTHLPLPLKRAAATPAAAATAVAAAATVPLPLSSAAAAAPALVDAPKLWALLASPLGEQRELQLAELADVEGDACSLDVPLLRAARPLAATIARLHCGVAYATQPLRTPCPHTDAETSAELSKWDTRDEAHCTKLRDESATSRFGTHRLERAAVRRSPLMARLGARCGDLLCAEQSCDLLAVRQCVEHLRSTAAPADRAPADQALAERCTAWLHHLPSPLKPMCDALTGRCLAPPEAHPGHALWPSVACLAQPPRAMCSLDAHSCGRCISGPAGRGR